VQAVVLSAKLRRLDAWTADRRAAAGQYRSRLGGGPVRLVDVVDPAAHVYHLMVARVPSRQRIRRSLAEVGIETGLHYPTPCHLLAPYRQFAVEALPVAERAAGEIVSLPMFPHLTSDQVARVCDEVQELADAEERPDVA
jgi:dTDP-4-amino-4,6-dideoxygalactose transaminase